MHSKKIKLLTLIIFICVIGLGRAETILAFRENTVPVGEDGKPPILQSTPFPADKCSDPTPTLEKKCETLEEQILASVVRLEVLEPDDNNPNLLVGGIGHGTIKDGRYVVVHNHFSVDLSIFNNQALKDHAFLNLYSANGSLLLREARPPIFKIVIEEEETLVLDFGTNEEGEGFFDWFRVPSAQFKNIHEISIQSGAEVAQVNWDGHTSFIDWVKVREVITDDGVPKIVLENALNDGSSGGGVYLNGVHIANNWMTVGVLDQAGEEIYQYSIAALNSIDVASKQE